MSLPLLIKLQLLSTSFSSSSAGKSVLSSIAWLQNFFKNKVSDPFMEKFGPLIPDLSVPKSPSEFLQRPGFIFGTAFVAYLALWSILTAISTAMFVLKWGMLLAGSIMAFNAAKQYLEDMEPPALPKVTLPSTSELEQRVTDAASVVVEAFHKTFLPGATAAVATKNASSVDADDMHTAAPRTAPRITMGRLAAPSPAA